MITAFGAAWPVAIVKSWKSKTTKGKSLSFLLIVELGYISGIMHKIIYSMDIVIIFYIINNPALKGRGMLVAIADRYGLYAGLRSIPTHTKHSVIQNALKGGVCFATRLRINSFRCSILVIMS